MNFDEKYKRQQYFKSKELDINATSLDLDRYDSLKFNSMYERNEVLQNFVDSNETIPSFHNLVGDVWGSLFQMTPTFKEEELSPTQTMQKSIVENIMKMEEYEEYHEATMFDDMVSAIGTMNYSENIVEWLQENLDEQSRSDMQGNGNETEEEKQQREERLTNAINDMLNKMQGDGQDGEDSQGQNGNGQNQQQGQGQSPTKQELQDSLAKAIAKANEQTQEQKEGVEAIFGKRKGTSDPVYDSVPLKEKLEMAKLLRKSPKMKRIAEMIGRLNKIARKKQKSKKSESNTRSGLTVGDDITMVVASELVQFKNPSTRTDFMRRFAEKQVLQYERKGENTLGKGSIIFVCDESGSMSGDREEKAKSIALAMALIAKKQKRNFVYIPFSSMVGEVKHYKKGKINSTDIQQIASNFMNGGTDFNSALKTVLDIVVNDVKDGDILFVTDGEDYISEDLITTFNTTRKAKKFSMQSIIVDDRDNGEESVLSKVSDTVIKTNDLLDSKVMSVFEI